jgi:hypothetical protein
MSPLGLVLMKGGSPPNISKSMQASAYWSLPATGGLLRAHVDRSPERETGLGQAHVVGAAHGFRDAEVGQDGPPPHEHHVLGLHVPVHHAVRVRVSEGLGHVHRDLDRLLHGQLPLPIEPIA